MKIFKPYLPIIQVAASSEGFTLIELIIATVLTGLMATLSGYGLSIMLNNNQVAEAETVRRTQLNRALEYISEDIRMARSINPASSYTIGSVTPSCATANPILNLTVPSGTSTKTIVYYLNDLSACTNSQAVWLKPGVIKRVDLGNSSSTIIDDGNGLELVDAISNMPAPVCSSGSIAPASNATGFYACLDHSSNASEVEIHLQTQLSPDSTKTYQVVSKAFTRSF